MIHDKQSVFLADDDMDDCLLFEDALSEVSVSAKLTTAKDGIELMHLLEQKTPPPPDVIFLDLNMPRRNGFECLNLIKQSQDYKKIPVTIFSTSCEPTFIDKVYKLGANYYICKPASFVKLKEAIFLVLSMNWSGENVQPSREEFLLTL